MKNKLLLPNKYKKIGWFILVPATILGLVLVYSDFEAEWITAPMFSIVTDGTGQQYRFFSVNYTNISNTLIGSLFIIGALLVGFSKEKQEDEFIAEIRLSSLLWAVLVSYLLLLLAFIFVYGIPFLNVMVYNMFTVLIIFIARFNYIMFKYAKTVPDEK